MEFDREAFINTTELAIDFGFKISDEDMTLYQKCLEERKNA